MIMKDNECYEEVNESSHQRGKPCFVSKRRIVTSSPKNASMSTPKIASTTSRGGNENKSSNMVGSGGDGNNYKRVPLEKEHVILTPPKRKIYIHNEEELMLGRSLNN
jgi:hypothetical protein